MIIVLYIDLLLSANELEGFIATKIGQTLFIYIYIYQRTCSSLCQTYGVA